ncbi:MAG: hypothetical protein LBL66_08090, partial [Clostridiales bacterium]|nr:hypothetical protein [Clostridiales bacterium]
MDENEREQLNDTEPEKREQGRWFGITARLFVALAAALCAFGGLVALAMEYVFPRLNESEQV